MTGRHRKHHPITVMAIGLAVLLGLDAVAWALWAAFRILPWLLAITITVVVCKHWQLHRRALAWLRTATTPPDPPRVVQGRVIGDDHLDHAELVRLRATTTPSC